MEIKSTSVFVELCPCTPQKSSSFNCLHKIVRTGAHLSSISIAADLLYKKLHNKSTIN